LKHAKDLSVEELTKLATKHIKEGEKVVRKIEDFQQEVLKKDPSLKFKAVDDHNLLHEPVVHHRHHATPTTSSLLETSSSVERQKKDASMPVPDILIERAAKRASEQAEDDIDALLSKAEGAITTDKKLVHDIGGFHAKIRSLKNEYEALAKSDAKDVATLRAEEALITKATSSHHVAPPKSAASITNEELSLLEDAASKIEHKGARRVRAKIGAQSEKHRHRRKHAHS
jgi:hypothetical protein